MADSFRPDSFEPDPMSFWEALLASAKERAGEIGQLPGDLMQSAKNVGTALSDKNLPLRLAPMTVPGAGPLATSAMNMGTEGLAQMNEGEFRPGALALSALPAFLAGGARATRAGNRMATRMLPGKFQAAHTEALDAAKNLTDSLTPDTRALYQQAGQAIQGAPVIPMPATGQMLTDLQAAHSAAPALSPASTANRELLDKVAPLGQGQVALSDLDPFMKELNLAIRTRAPGGDAAKAISGSAVRDLEAAAGAGNAGADAMRQAAEGYKSAIGAGRLQDQITKASPPLTGNEPALNIRALSKSVRNDKELPRLLGPSGMAKVQEFLDQNRGLPPERMSTLATIGKSMLGTGSGGYIGNAVGGQAGAAIGGLLGALGPEYLQNLMFVGRNPAAINQGATLAGQGLRPLLLKLLQ